MFAASLRAGMMTETFGASASATGSPSSDGSPLARQIATMGMTTHGAAATSASVNTWARRKRLAWWSSPGKSSGRFCGRGRPCATLHAAGAAAPEGQHHSRIRDRIEMAHDVEKGYREVPASAVIEMQGRGDDVTFVDVREQHEWNLFRIAGAIHIPVGRVRDEAPRRLQTGRTILLYCARGGRAATAAATLAELGFANVLSLEGGLMAWVNAGGALEE